jgi:hypothetical protein
MKLGNFGTFSNLHFWCWRRLQYEDLLLVVSIFGNVCVLEKSRSCV